MIKQYITLAHIMPYDRFTHHHQDTENKTWITFLIVTLRFHSPMDMASNKKRGAIYLESKSCS
jgi:hypothetical protein